jgi:peptidoglycan/LPS O-acetylase OafA/YrhL
MGVNIAAQGEAQRLRELDSLRGLAAFSVVIHHLVLLGIGNHLAGSPALLQTGLMLLLQPVAAGSEAVILFFVLSGLVLSVPAIEGRPQPYRVFIVRRIFRIYLPFLAAILIAIAGNACFYGSITSSVWFHQFWTVPVKLPAVVEHLLFLGAYNTDRFDPPIWSLVHEMRISMVFPLLCGAVMAVKSGRAVAVSLAASIGSCLLEGMFPPAYSYLSTLRYAVFFVVGICIYREKNRIRDFYCKMPAMRKKLLLLAALLLYLYAGKILSIDTAPSSPTRIVSLLFGDWFVAAGAAAIIVAAIHSNTLRRMLLQRWIVWLGEMSYSLYLTHFIVLLLMVHMLYGRVPLTLLLALYLPASFVLSRMFYVAVERPSMNLGRRLCHRMG